MTVGSIAAILQDCGIPQERIEAFQESCEEKFGAGAVLAPANLIDAGKFEIRTSQVAVSDRKSVV